jgi:hypothetical protein
MWPILLYLLAAIVIMQQLRIGWGHDDARRLEGERDFWRREAVRLARRCGDENGNSQDWRDERSREWAGG